MSKPAADFALSFVRELEGFRRELALFPDDASIWKTIPGVTNSAGNLALHVAGNLQYFIGTVLGHTGYVRHRDVEFGRTSGLRDDVYAELDAASAVVMMVLPPLEMEALTGEYPERVMDTRFRTGAFLVHLCSHAAFHLGQAGYLRRVLTGDATSSGPIPLGPLSL